MKDPNEIVAVKCEGCFTEWYSPFFKDPYEDNAEYREFYNTKMLNHMPVIGPSLGNDEWLSGDLGCLADRLTVGADDWAEARNVFSKAVGDALQSGEVQVLDFLYTDPKVTDILYTDPKVTDILITPVRRKDMPKVDEEHLKVYGRFADLIRERVAAI